MKPMLLLAISIAIGMPYVAIAAENQTDKNGAAKTSVSRAAPRAADGSVRPGGGTKANDAALLPAVKSGNANRNTSSDAALLPAVRPSSATVKGKNADKAIVKQ